MMVCVYDGVCVDGGGGGLEGTELHLDVVQQGEHGHEGQHQVVLIGINDQTDGHFLQVSHLLMYRCSCGFFIATDRI